MRFLLGSLLLVSAFSFACSAPEAGEDATADDALRTGAGSVCSGPKSTVTLSDGSRATVPFCASNVDVTAVVATAETSEVGRVLARDFALYPVEHRGRAIVMVLSQAYRESDIGPYNEVIVAAMASERPLSLGVANLTYLLQDPSQDPSLDPVRMVLLKVYVDTTAALRLGNEVWSMDKRLVRIRADEYDGLTVSGDRGMILGISPTALYPLASVSLPTLPLEFEVETVGRVKGIADYSRAWGFSLPMLPNLLSLGNPFGSYVTYGTDEDSALFLRMDLRLMALTKIEGTAVGLSKRE